MENNNHDSKKELARKNFDIVCASLDKNNLKYIKDEDELHITCAAQGDDLPMEMHIIFEVEHSLLILTSHLPFQIEEEKRVDIALAVSAINYVLLDGNFDYDIRDGHLFFKMTNSFIDTEIAEEFFMYLLMVSFRTIDEYNDQLLMLSKGLIDLETFISRV